jgi:hypothetical protein
MRRRCEALLGISGVCLAGVLTAAPAAAQPVLLLRNDTRLALEPLAAPSSLGGRVELATKFGEVNTSMTAAVEYGGRKRSTDTPWDAIVRPALWSSDDLQINARWAPFADASLSLEAGNRQQRTHDFANSFSFGGDSQLSIDQSRFLRLRLAAKASQMDVLAGVDTITNALDARTADDSTPSATQRWVTSRKVFGDLAWRPFPQLSLHAGQAVQSFAVGWRGATEMTSQATYLTPSAALVFTPWTDATWRLDAEETVTPIDSGQFAAYAQLVTSERGSAPQPDRGLRYGLSVDHLLPGGVRLGARANLWRMASVTDLGPVGAGQAPVSIGGGTRRQIQLNVATSLSALGLSGTTLAGEVNWRNSHVTDPFTGNRRRISGEAPYGAQLRLSGALRTPDLSWAVVAKADGPKSFYQLASVTSLSRSAGLDGSVTYGAGPVRLSLELDNLVGGLRGVTTYNYAGSRADSALADILRRNDDSRAVRISLRRRM